MSVNNIKNKIVLSAFFVFKAIFRFLLLKEVLLYFFNE